MAVHVRTKEFRFWATLEQATLLSAETRFNKFAWLWL